VWPALISGMLESFSGSDLTRLRTAQAIKAYLRISLRIHTFPMQPGEPGDRPRDVGNTAWPSAEVEAGEPMPGCR